MPRNTREWAHRKIEQSKGNLEWCQTHLLEVADKYTDAHPEIAEPLVLVVEALSALKSALDKVKAKI